MLAAALFAFHCLHPAGLFSAPFVLKQVVEKWLLHLVGVCDQVTSGPLVMASGPTPYHACFSAEALILDGALPAPARAVTDRRPPWVFAEGVAAESADGLLVVHRMRRTFRDVLAAATVRIGRSPFRIDVDRPICTAPSARKLTFAAVAFVAEPSPLGPQ